MRNVFNTLFFLEILISTNIYAQNTGYWQQEVNNKINVKLDDSRNRLYGNIEIEYINHSPDNLQFIYFHLWMNAYKDVSTAFAKQQVRNGSTSFYYADLKDRGFIDSLAFTVDGKPAKLEIDTTNPDIAKLILNEPLKSGERIIIYTPFREQLPHTFSRGGHIGNAYQVTQWFPKPAVYDRKGWHPIPYLDIGEFYAEFGNYDVSITVPENYVVAATGNLQTETELNWLDKLADENALTLGLVKDTVPHGLSISGSRREPVMVDGISFPQSSPDFKTIRYTQENVHDFAWFADKRFHVLKSHIAVPGTRKAVTSWAFFLDRNQHLFQVNSATNAQLTKIPQKNTLWKYAPQYIDSAVYYYSKWIGSYPYDNVTAVEGPLSAGEGMEYPTITIIGNVSSDMMLETVIAHEVGHNWLQGVLGFNERDYPWMDEGINSYYERRYIQQRYPHYNLLGALGKVGRDLTGIDSMGNYFEDYETSLFQERRHEDQAVCLKSTEYSMFNYGAMIYAKMPYCMRYLENYLGIGEFDKVMQSFYKEWQHKHPQPEDLQAHFNKETGKELDWFFNEMLCSTKKLDYKLVSAGDTVHIGGRAFVKIKVRNSGGIKGPLSISAYKNQKIATTLWYGGFFGNNELLMPYDNYEGYRIDAQEVIPEYNRHNNTLRGYGILKKTEPFRLQPFGSIENPYRTELYFSPIVGYNKYDGAMFGLALYNSFIPVKNTEFLLMPMFSTNTNRLRGIARLNTFIYPKSESVQYLNLQVSGSEFSSYLYNDRGNSFFDNLYRLSASINLKLKSKKINLSNTISLRNIYLNDHYDFEDLTPNGVNIIPQHSIANYSQLKYLLENKRKINPFSFEVLSELGYNDHNMGHNIRATFNYRFNYNAHKGLDIRLFTEYGDKNSGITLYSNGSTDYTFDHYFIGRSEATGLAAHQIYEGFGFMKFNPAQLLSNLGTAQSFVFSVNLKTDIPYIPFLFLFADAGYYDVNSTLLDNIPSDAGVGIKIIPGIFEMYLPLFVSTDIKQNIYSTPEYKKLFSRVMFTLQMEKLDVFKMIRNIQL